MNRRLEEVHAFTNIIHEKVLRRVEIDKFEDLKRALGGRLDAEALKVKDLVRRVDPMEKRLELLLADLENKFKELNFKFNKLQEKIDKDFKDTEERLKKGGTGANNFADDSELMRFLKKQFMCDAHQPATEGGMVMERLTKLEEENIRIVNDHIKLNALIISLQADVANKIDLATFSMQIGRKIDKDEMLEMIKTLTLDEEKSKKMETDIGKLKKKLKETIDFVEDKLKAFKKDFDMPYLQKLLKAKAEEKDVKNQFKSMNESLTDHKLLFDSLKKDLDGLVVAYKKLSQFLALLQDEDANTLASAKALLCLSCGRGSKFPPEMKQVARTHPGDGQRRQHVLRGPGTRLRSRPEQVRPRRRSLQLFARSHRPHPRAPPRAAHPEAPGRAEIHEVRTRPQPLHVVGSTAVFA